MAVGLESVDLGPFVVFLPQPMHPTNLVCSRHLSGIPISHNKLGGLVLIYSDMLHSCALIPTPKYLEQFFLKYTWLQYFFQ